MSALVARLNSRIVQCGDCWEYFGSRDRLGYGRFGGTEAAGRSLLVHRQMFEEHNGTVPKGMELDHLCRNTSCCRPDHLEAVTHQVNVARGRAGYAKNDRCKHGHDLNDPTNVYVHTRGRNGRKCRTCALANARRAHTKKKEQRNV